MRGRRGTPAHVHARPFMDPCSTRPRATSFLTSEDHRALAGSQNKSRALPTTRADGEIKRSWSRPDPVVCGPDLLTLSLPWLASLPPDDSSSLTESLTDCPQWMRPARMTTTARRHLNRADRLDYPRPANRRPRRSDRMCPSSGSQRLPDLSMSGHMSGCILWRHGS